MASGGGGYFFILRLGKFILWLFKGFKGKFHDIDQTKALLTGIVASIIMMVLIYFTVVKQ